MTTNQIIFNNGVFKVIEYFVYGFIQYTLQIAEFIRIDMDSMTYNTTMTVHDVKRGKWVGLGEDVETFLINYL